MQLSSFRTPNGIYMYTILGLGLLRSFVRGSVDWYEYGVDEISPPLPPERPGRLGFETCGELFADVWQSMRANMVLALHDLPR